MFVFVTKDSVHEEFSYLALEPSEALQLLEAGPLPFAMGSGEGGYRDSQKPPWNGCLGKASSMI